jgi:hypothetical protein
LRSGETNFLTLLDQLRIALPPGKILSIAAYPPPSRWHPFEDVHWNEQFFREIARRCDQLAVMMYDTSLRRPRLYQHVMAGWTREIIDWSEGRQTLLGLPVYHDAGVGYHDPNAENLTNALLGVHRGLFERTSGSTNYQGVAIYCEWEMDDSEWRHFREHFMRP